MKAMSPEKGPGEEIAALRLAEERLALERDRAQQYLDVAAVMLVALDREGRISLINQKGCEILGYPGDEALLGADWFSLILPEEEAEETREVFRKLMSGETDTAEYHENKVRTARGSTRLVAWHNTILRDAEGRPAGTLSSGEDITDRRAVEDELMASKAFVESLIQASPGVIYTYDLVRRRNVFASAEITSLLGFSPQEIREMGDQVFPRLMHPEAMAAVQEHHRALEEAQDGQTRTVEYRMLHKDGNWRWLRSVDTPFLRGESGRVEQIVGICEDDTDRREALDGLRRFEMVVSSSTDLLAFLDRSYKYLVANRAYHEAFQRSPGTLVGKSVHEVFGSKFLEEVIIPHAEQALSGKVTTYEAWFDLPGTGRRFLGVSYSPYVDGGTGEVIGFAVNARDMTDLKKAEEALTALNQELEERVRERTAQLELSNRELESFSYSVSHDLRAPLRAIDGFSKALAEDCGDKLDPGGRKHLGRIRTNTQRMRELIDDILQLSRVARARMVQKKVDLSSMALEIAQDLRSEDPGRKAAFDIASHLTVQGDPRLLRSVMENLLGNAWKFSKNREHTRIEVGMETRDGIPWCFVRDNGAGFDMAYADKLFGPFQRLHSENEFPGSGIGLATVQRILQRHHGRIRAEGSVDGGATIYFHLPGQGRK